MTLAGLEGIGDEGGGCGWTGSGCVPIEFLVFFLLLFFFFVFSIAWWRTLNERMSNEKYEMSFA